MTRLELDLLALRVRPHVTFADSGKPHVRLAKLRPEDRRLVTVHADALRRRLAPWLYFNGREITQAEVADCLRDVGGACDTVPTRRALEMTKAWLRHSAEFRRVGGFV